MSDTESYREQRGRPKAAPRPLSVRLRRRASRALKVIRRLPKTVREALRRGYKGVERAPHWRRGRPRVLLGRAAVWVGAILFVVLVARAVYVIARGSSWGFPFNVDSRCTGTGYSCGVASSLLMTLLTLAFAGWLFVVRRLRRVRRPYVKRARSETQQLVPTAGAILGDVVGRDEVCHVIMDDLREAEGRRPHVILGGIGVGKTAVMYHLTRLLAENGAVPVPIRLRDAQKGLDFAELARRRFVSEVSTSSLSDAEADRVWRELSKDDQIVVLADGLEEALSDDPSIAERAKADANGGDTREWVERDNQIRLSIRAAQRRGLPLVVASRPHEALVGLDAAVVELEYLGEEAALEYIEHGASTQDPHRLDWVIETAEVTETPLFLQIARELHQRGLLEAARRDPKGLDTRGGDRPALRLKLLQSWTQALIDGHFEPDLPITPDLRRATVEQLAALACMGLKKDRLEVDFADLLATVEREEPEGDESKSVEYCHRRLIKYLERLAGEANAKQIGTRTFDARIKREIRLAASRGSRLRLVEAYGEGVRFPHSILQAYLASRVLDNVLDDDPEYVKHALAKASRELLIALTLYSRMNPSRHVEEVRTALTDARNRKGLEISKQIDILVAALEVDCVMKKPEPGPIARDLVTIWPPASEDRTVEDAKLQAIGRFGEAARTAERQGVEPPYVELFEIARMDLGYRVRLAAAHELTKGGNVAFELLEAATVGRKGGKQRTGGVLRPATEGQELVDDDDYREFALRAWLAPMFVGSTDATDGVEPAMEEEPTASSTGGIAAPLDAGVGRTVEQRARANLEDWLNEVKRERGPEEKRFPLTLEVALAQGFKHAANRRPQHPQARAEARDHLAERANTMMKAAHFWYSRLTLVHALCLWALPTMSEQAARNGQPAGVERRRRARRTREPQRRDSDPEALVSNWLATARPGREHPFVAEARELAILALQTRQPERFIWIDESAAVTKIGGRGPTSNAVRKHNLWIPASVGWSALHPRAQKLVADVLLLLNLIEREGDPVKRNERMSRANRDDLPPCLKGDRENLEPAQTVGTALQPTPGGSCKHGCHFDLCPYPPKGIQPYRVELSQAFCRRQQVLLGRRYQFWSRRTARWQGAVPGDLKRFWREMEERARR